MNRSLGSADGGEGDAAAAPPALVQRRHDPERDVRHDTPPRAHVRLGGAHASHAAALLPAEEDQKRQALRRAESTTRDAAAVLITRQEAEQCVQAAKESAVGRGRALAFARSVPHDAEMKHCDEELAVFNVLFLEPASLKKLVHYPGPMSHSLRCAFYEDRSDRLVLAIHKKQNEQNRNVTGSGPSALLNSASNGSYPSTQLFSDQSNTGDENRDGLSEGEAERVSGPMYNHIDILQISKRHFKRNKNHQEDEENPEEQQPQERVLLCIEKSRPSMLHSDSIDQRENSEHSLELIRRVMYSDVISAIALSASSSWLFTGHRSGALKVWNVATSGSKSRVMSHQLGNFPLESEPSAWHKDPVDTIRLSATTPSFSGELENHMQLEPTEIMVITAARDSGLVKHWRFQVTYRSMKSHRQHTFEAAKVLPLVPERELLPRVELVGAYNTDLSLINEQAKPTSKKKPRPKKLVESVLATVPIWVAINMSSFTENLLLVLRDGVIHVLKVQSVMRIVQEIPAFEDITSIRIVEHQAVPTLVALSGNQISSIRVFPLDSSVNVTMQNASYHQQLAPPPSQQSPSFVSAMECFQLDQQRSFVVYGWSTGGLEIYSLYPSRRVTLLQDPRLNAHVTAVCVIPHSRHQAHSSASFQSPDTESKAISTRSWGGLLKSRDSRLQGDALLGNVSHIEANTAQDQIQLSKAYVFAGTANGQIFGWKVPFPQDPSATCQFLLELKLSVCSAHSTHVVQLVALEQDNKGAQRLMSLGADGMVKVWDISTMSIIGTNSSSETSDAVEFLTCSLDMTTIIWVIHEDKVAEKRYFDVGAPIIDFCVAENQAIAVLAHEICAFEYCIQSSTASITAFPHSSIDRLDPHGLLVAVSTELQFYRSATRPDTPTTHLDDEVVIESSHPIVRAVERGITNSRVSTPKAKAEPSITVPSALITSTKFTAKPVNNAAHSEIPAEKKTDLRLQTPIYGDELCRYLEQYIESNGTNGTMAADALNHFLSTQRLVTVSRPDFAIRKYLQENKIDPKTRLNVCDACEILLAIQSSTVSKKGKYDKKQQCVEKIVQQDKIRLRKTHEKQMANRKAVISFNILGEKSIRWEVVEDANPTEIHTQQPSDAGGVQSSGESQDQRSPKSPSIRVPTDQAVPLPDERLDIAVHDEEHSISLKAAAVTLDDDGLDGVSSNGPLKRQRYRKISVADSMGPKMRDEPPDPDLVNRLKLSKCFRNKWSGGYCWCTSWSELRVVWTEDSKPEEEANQTMCEDCGKRAHLLKLSRYGYKQHFSLRMILGVIVDVYDELMGPSHNLLFKSTATRGSAGAAEDTDPVSVHSALFRVFTKKFGMPKVVEDKIKLLLLSITHFVHEVDAIAVFGELLGIFARNQSYDDAHVPDEMVALCVSCYSWFYSREMVINGESILGSSRNGGENLHRLQGGAPITEIEHGKRNNWQFVKLENALLCAEEMLMYPLVSPGYLRNILLYAAEYAQAYPTKPQLAGEDNDEGVEAGRLKRMMWIEVHRFLRLLVGEWKQQNTEFRVVEQTLFIQPLAEAAASSSATETRAVVTEKLRLILSCFIFYDHDREGVMTIEDFTNILRKLRYLWPNEDMTAEEAASSNKDSLTFENTILAAKRHFADLEGDGQICYLDFWAMLYIVGVRALSLLKFREIPSFCRDYKLEISSDLHGLLLCYMQRSSTMMLPRGFQLEKSSLDQRTSIQHRRRVGGLHDGLFRMPKRLDTSFSLQELLAQSDPQQMQKRGVKDQIYLDGSAPSLRQSASMTAMDRFRPVSRDAGVSGSTRVQGVSPVALGIRPTGPREKPRAFLAVSAIANDDLPTNTDPARSSSVPISNPEENAELMQQDSHARTFKGSNPASIKDKSMFSNVYVQFPFVSPRRDRIEIPTKEIGQGQHTAGEIALLAEVDKHSGAYQWHSEIIKEYEEQQQREAILAPFTPLPDGREDVRPGRNANKSGTGATLDVGLSHALHRKDHTALRQSSRLAPTAVDADVQQAALVKSAPDVPVVQPVKKKSETLVVIPKIENDSVKTRTTSGMIAADTMTHRLPPRQTKVPISDSVALESSSPIKESNSDIAQQEHRLDSSLIQDEDLTPGIKESVGPLDAHDPTALSASTEVQPHSLPLEEHPVTLDSIALDANGDGAHATNEFELPDEGDDDLGGEENSDENSEDNSEEETSDDGSDGAHQDSSKETTARTARSESEQEAERVDLNAGVPRYVSESDELVVTHRAVSDASANTFVTEPKEISRVEHENSSTAVPDEQPQSKVAPLHEPKVVEPAWSISTKVESNLPQKIQEVAHASPPTLFVEVPVPVESIPDQIVLPKESTKSSRPPELPTNDEDDAASNTNSNLPSHHYFRFSQ
ncbi:hypothetical protein FI667_g14215, partial [Globisporangium splendens]